MISLSLITRLISVTMSELTHTCKSAAMTLSRCRNRTLFADEGIVAVIRVVRISCRRASAVANGAEVELYMRSANIAVLCCDGRTQELVSKPTRMP